MRFRSWMCGPQPPARVVSVGTGCGFIYNPLLASYAGPALGLPNWPLSLGFSGFAQTGYVFWAAGTNPTGLPIVPGGLCLFYLDPGSLASYYAAGLEPLASSSTPVGQFFSWSFALPGSPSLLGASVGLQGIVIGPYGFPLGGGVNAMSSNALQITLGY